TIEEIEKNYITQILKENNGNISQAAKFLGLSRQNLQYRIKKLHLQI
ncbi:helix-turn-helix domain-containing protein, partial [Bacillus cereus]